LQENQGGRIASADQRCGKNLDRPGQNAVSVDEIGQKWADEQKWNHPQAKHQDQDETQAGVRIPRCNAEGGVGLNETDSVDRHIRSKVDQPDNGLAGLNDPREGRCSQPHRLRPLEHLDI
jgi:hypothetical protein